MPAKFFSILALTVFMWANGFAAENSSLPFVSPMFGDNMVLQRGKPNTIWGWAKPGEKVSVEISGTVAEAVTGANGRWQVQIQPPPVGGPYTIKIDGPQHVEFHEVLVGDVWLCGGQSNMEIPLAFSRNGGDEVKKANHPEIRIFTVKQQIDYTPAPIPQGQWKICSPQSVAEDGGFSAVAYYFGVRVQNDIHVPIGLIKDAVGGTPAETWTGSESLQQLKDFDAQLAEVKRLSTAGGTNKYGNYIMHWYDDYDQGIKGKTWAATDFDDSHWKTVQIPGGFQDLGVADAPSVCWFRKQIVLPDPLPTNAATLRLGVVERMDTTYVNGTWVGASAWVENPRVYRLKPGVLKPGTNVVTVRVFKVKPDGGFMSKPEGLKLVLGNSEISLAGEWKGAVSVDARAPHPLPLGFENWPVMPTVLYEGMIEPVAPLALTGALWYQGEANADRAYQYRTLLPAMIGDWRQLFGQGDFPFYVVSLPAFMHHQTQPTDAAWAEMREAQAIVAHTVKNSGSAVTIDTGDPDNIHPPDKKIVGERLALCALAQHYGEKISYQGPRFSSLEHMSGALKLNFDHADGGLVVKGDKLGEFSVAGKDHKWHWADAKIDGKSVVVSSSDVPEPEAARYAWQSFPTATLYNGEGLPAEPFRTDSWKEITQTAPATH